MTGAEIALGASNLLLGTAVGAGVNQSIFVMPKWFESPPESLSQVRDRSPAKFWIPLQAASTVALVSAFVLNRTDAARRRRLAIALGLYAGTWIVTGAYFAPEIMRLSKAGSDLPAHEIARRGSRWLKLSWGRQLAMAAAWAATVAALVGRRPARTLGRLAR